MTMCSDPVISVPEEDEIHQCPILKYHCRYLMYCCTGRGNARWRLIYAQHGDPRKDDMVDLQVVLFCPCCGQDFRRDTGTHHAGDPSLNEILKASLSAPASATAGTKC